MSEHIHTEKVNVCLFENKFKIKFFIALKHVLRSRYVLSSRYALWGNCLIKATCNPTLE